MTALLGGVGIGRAALPRALVALGLAAFAAALAIPQADVGLYHRYAIDLLHARGARRLPVEYPALSVLVFAAPSLLPLGYRVAFAVTMSGAFGVLVVLGIRRCGRPWATRLCWYLGAGAAAVLFARYDLVPACATFVAVHESTRRRWGRAWVAALLGAALKVFPVLLLPGFAIAEWRETGRFPWRRVGVAAAATGLFAAMQTLFAPGSVLTPMRYEWRRGFEYSSVPGSLGVLIAPLHLHWAYAFGAIEVFAPGHEAIALGTTLAEVGSLGALWMWAWRRRLPAAEVGLAVLSVAVLTDRAFAPQYLVWLAPLWAMFPLRRLWLAAAFLTSMTYPLALAIGVFHFHSVLPATLVALVRNAVLLTATVLWLRERIRVAVQLPAGFKRYPGSPPLSTEFPAPVPGVTTAPVTKEVRSFALDGR